MVSGSLNYRPVTLMVVIALVALTGFMFTKTSSELAPEEDQGFLLSLVTAPRYATSDYTETYVNQILGLVKDIPETRAQFSAVAFGGATNSAFVGFAFKDWAERKRSSKQLQADITARIAKVAGVQAFVFAPPTLPGIRRRPADLDDRAFDRRFLRSLRSGRADQEQGAGFRPFHRRAEFDGL